MTSNFSDFDDLAGELESGSTNVPGHSAQARAEATSSRAAGTGEQVSAEATADLSVSLVGPLSVTDDSPLTSPAAPWAAGADVSDVATAATAAAGDAGLSAASRHGRLASAPGAAASAGAAVAGPGSPASPVPAPARARDLLAGAPAAAIPRAGLGSPARRGPAMPGPTRPDAPAVGPGGTGAGHPAARQQAGAVRTGAGPTPAGRTPRVSDLAGVGGRGVHAGQAKSPRQAQPGPPPASATDKALGAAARGLASAVGAGALGGVADRVVQRYGRKVVAGGAAGLVLALLLPLLIIVGLFGGGDDDDGVGEEAIAALSGQMPAGWAQLLSDSLETGDGFPVPWSVMAAIASEQTDFGREDPYGGHPASSPSQPASPSPAAAGTTASPSTQATDSAAPRRSQDCDADWTPIGGGPDQGSGAFLLNPNDVADLRADGGDPANPCQAADFVAKRLSATADQLVAEGAVYDFEYRKPQVNTTFWAAVIDRSGLFVDPDSTQCTWPEGGSGAVDEDGDSDNAGDTSPSALTDEQQMVVSHIEYLWNCELSRSPAVWLAESVTLDAAGKPSVAYSTGSQVRQTLISDALSVSWAFSGWSNHRCAAGGRYAGVFPLEAGDESALHIDRCKVDENIDAAARQVVKKLAVPPSARAHVDPSRPYAPLAWGWNALPVALGTDVALLQRSGPAGQDLNDSCAAAAHQWVDDLARRASSPLEKLGAAPTEDTAALEPAGRGALLVITDPRATGPCATMDDALVDEAIDYVATAYLQRIGVDPEVTPSHSPTPSPTPSPGWAGDTPLDQFTPTPGTTVRPTSVPEDEDAPTGAPAAPDDGIYDLAVARRVTGISRALTSVRADQAARQKPRVGTTALIGRLSPTPLNADFPGVDDVFTSTAASGELAQKIAASATDIWGGVGPFADTSDDLNRAKPSPCTPSGALAQVGDVAGSVKGLSDDQVHNAAVILAQAKLDLGADWQQGAIVGIATSMQESTLRNIAYGDRDSIGLFQQRNAWASFAERHNPPAAAHMFFTGGHKGQRGLRQIKNWQQLPVTVAAQKVQVSAYPQAYAKWESLARDLVTQLAGQDSASGPTPTTPAGGCGGAGGSPLDAPLGAVGDCKGASTAGYPNGQLPRSALCPLWGSRGGRLRADAAYAFNRMSQAYAQQFGQPICVTDSYRDYATQVRLKAQKGRMAATPGKSNHGWGLATDLCGGINNWGTATRNWMVAHAPSFGWFCPGWAQKGRGKEEPWHWEFGQIS